MMRERLLSWAPVVGWMAVVFGFSTGGFDASHTADVLWPILSWLLPWASPADITALHELIRKTAHFMEYAILAVLWRRAFMREGVRARQAAWLALAASAAWAGIDETHQSTVMTRTGSVMDVLLDTTGAATALLVLSSDVSRLVERATVVVLWMAAIGGLVFLVVNGLTGVASGALLVTTPAAAALLAWLWRRH
jgi:VanZ family protein